MSLCPTNTEKPGIQNKLPPIVVQPSWVRFDPRTPRGNFYLLVFVINRTHINVQMSFQTDLRGLLLNQRALVRMEDIVKESFDIMCK
jgi:hypothetical protein